MRKNGYGAGMAIDLQQCRENFKQRAAIEQATREMLRKQAREAAIAAISQIVPRYPCITQVYLFGSAIRPGQFHDRSDIDIAVAGTDAATYLCLLARVGSRLSPLADRSARR